MTYREMAIDAGAVGEDEICRMAAMIEEEIRRQFEEERIAQYYCDLACRMEEEGRDDE